jgi:hypothetical protein
MEDTAVAAALTELHAALDALAPQHEGLRDYARLNLKPETLTEVRGLLEAYDRRVSKLQAAIAPLEALVADGHPDLGPRAIADAALQDLQANVDTIAAARAQFVSDAPTVLNLSASAPEAK